MADGSPEVARKEPQATPSSLHLSSTSHKPLSFSRGGGGSLVGGDVIDGDLMGVFVERGDQVGVSVGAGSAGHLDNSPPPPGDESMRDREETSQLLKITDKVGGVCVRWVMEVLLLLWKGFFVVVVVVVVGLYVVLEGFYIVDDDCCVAGCCVVVVVFEGFFDTHSDPGHLFPLHREQHPGAGLVAAAATAAEQPPPQTAAT